MLSFATLLPLLSLSWAISACGGAIAAEQPYTINKNTAFERKATGVSSLIGQHFIVNRLETYIGVSQLVTDMEEVTVTAAKVADETGTPLILLARPSGLPVTSDWYSPGDFGLMDTDVPTKIESMNKQACQTDAYYAVAKTQK